jgi:hypothetical protein
VWEAVVETWAEELRKRSTSAHPEAHGPTTKVETRDERDCLVKFAVREGWTYLLTEVDWQGPDWANKMEYKPQSRPGKLDAEVLVGLQVENGPRVEQRVRADTSETALKRIIWHELEPPECARRGRRDMHD